MEFMEVAFGYSSTSRRSVGGRRLSGRVADRIQVVVGQDDLIAAKGRRHNDLREFTGHRHRRGAGTSAAPGNLGPASQGVEAGRTIAIPKSVGRIDTTLRGTTGGADAHAVSPPWWSRSPRFEHDDSRVGDIVDLHDVVITESKRRLETELRRSSRKYSPATFPLHPRCAKRPEAQIDEETPGHHRRFRARP